LSQRYLNRDFIGYLNISDISY